MDFSVGGAKPGSLMTVTIAAKKNMTKISKEKQYWQQLAKEYEKKIELLKQAKASAQARKKEQRSVVNMTSRNIDNNEVFSTPLWDSCNTWTFLRNS